MAYRPNKLGRMAIKIQGSGWGTAETSFAATNYLEAEVGVPVVVQESHRIDPIRSGFEESEVLAGARIIDVPFRIPFLHGWSTGTPGADATEHPDALLMRLALGLSVQTGYVAANIASGGSTSLLKFTTANTNWEGSGLLVPVSGTPAFELAAIGDITTAPTPDEGTPIVALQRTPASSGAHYGSNTIYLANDTPAPITMDWIGPDAGSHVRYMDGLVKSLRVVGSAKKPASMEGVLRFTGPRTFPGSGGSLAAYTYGFPAIPPLLKANGSGVYFNGSWTPVSEASFGVDLTLGDPEGWGSDEGVVQQMVTDRKVTSTVLIPSTGTFTNEILAPGTAITKLFAVLACATPGRSAGWLLPAPVLVDTAQFRDRNALLAVEYTMAPQVYAGDGGVGAGAGNKSARFFFA